MRSQVKLGNEGRALVRDNHGPLAGIGRLGFGIGIRRGIDPRRIVLAVLGIGALQRARNGAVVVVRVGTTRQGENRAQSHKRQVEIRVQVGRTAGVMPRLACSIYY